MVRSALAASRMRQRLHELGVDNVSVNRGNISESEFRQDQLLTLREAGIPLKEAAAADLTTDQLADLATQYDNGSLSPDEVRQLFDTMKSGDMPDVLYDANHPVASLNAATVDGRLPEGASWKIADTAHPDLGNYASLTINDSAQLENVREALNAAGFVVLEGMDGDKPTLIIPEEYLTDPEAGIDLSTAVAQLDVTLPVTDVLPAPESQAVGLSVSVFEPS